MSADKFNNWSVAYYTIIITFGTWRCACVCEFFFFFSNCGACTARYEKGCLVVVVLVLLGCGSGANDQTRSAYPWQLGLPLVLVVEGVVYAKGSTANRRNMPMPRSFSFVLDEDRGRQLRRRLGVLIWLVVPQPVYLKLRKSQINFRRLKFFFQNYLVKKLPSCRIPWCTRESRVDRATWFRKDTPLPVNCVPWFWSPVP